MQHNLQTALLYNLTWQHSATFAWFLFSLFLSQRFDQLQTPSIFLKLVWDCILSNMSSCVWSHLPNVQKMSNKERNLFPLCRYFVLDPELGQLQYFLNEQSKTQKPRGSLPLIGSSVAPSDEFPFMFTVYAVNGELFKLRGKRIISICFWSCISALSLSHSLLLALVKFTFLCFFLAVTHSLSSLPISFETYLSDIF